MRRILLILFILLFTTLVSSVFAQTGTPSGNLRVDVSASVGEFLLTLSGVQSKNASIVLTSKDGTFLASTVADSSGNFSFSVHIKSGFSGFCLTTIDFARLGDTTVCVDVEPAKGNIVMRGILLPPTLGISRTEIGVGAKALVSGYTMPGARVTINISNGLTITATADKNGYWEATIENLPVGKYDIFATASYQNTESLTPTKSKQITVISAPRKVVKEGVSFLKASVEDLFNSLKNLGGLFWIAIVLVIAILILLRKLYPQAFAFPEIKMFAIPWKFSKVKKLHHWWFVGY